MGLILRDAGRIKEELSREVVGNAAIDASSHRVGAQECLRWG